LAGGLQGGGDGAFHAGEVDGEVAGEIEVGDLRPGARAIGPGGDGVDEERDVGVGVQFPAFDVIGSNWKILGDFFQEEILSALLGYLLKGP
jgi:hypothetical protein